MFEFSLLNPRQPYLLTLIVLFWLSSCGHPPVLVQPVGVAYPDSSAQPDSVRVKLVLEVPNGTGSDELSGVLWAVPQERYRLELTGPMGIQVASVLWKPDGWLALVPPQERFVAGAGSVIFIPGLLLPAIPIHTLLAYSWGQLLPPGLDSARCYEYKSQRICDWTTPEHLTVRAEFNAQTHHLLALVIPSPVPDVQLRMEYADNSMRVVRGGQWLMTMRIHERRSDLAWKGGIWKLIVPDGYRN